MKRTLKPVFPPAGIEAEYRKRLLKAIREMETSCVAGLSSTYQANENKIVDSAVDNLLQEFRRLLAIWEKKFQALADVLPKWFVSKIRGYVARNLAEQTKPLRDAGLGFNLKFSYMSEKEKQTFQAIIAENVNLIKSIARESLTQVEGIVLRSIENGHDLATLTEELHKQFGVTERRAAMIARDQTHKATENLARARLKSYGINRGIWVHTPSGKTYRKTHIDILDGKEYDLEEGLYDPAKGVERKIHPAELVNCYCVCRPLIPTLSEEETEAGIEEILQEVGEPLPETPKAETSETQEEKPQENISTEEGLSSAGAEIINRLDASKIEYNAVREFNAPISTTEIIDRIGGGDMTKGSCVSVAHCYVGNKAGLEVFDFRGGDSWSFFARRINSISIAKLPGVTTFFEEMANDYKAAKSLFTNAKEGKEYMLIVGRHGSIIRKTKTGIEYLELQSSSNNGWHEITDEILKRRFGCARGRKYIKTSMMIDVESLGKSKDYKKILGYLNTAKGKQKKGVKGYAK